ncbi:MAG: branched-chain amino acid ABC transporter permease [Rhizobiaceae bacterium]|nr:branched-chain amino acid ABC transporter permease [Rhizobiaceae bacterium]
MSSGQWIANQVLNGLVEGLVVALVALAITLVYAIARFSNAATGDYLTFGAYVTKGAATWTGSLAAGFVAGMVATALLSVFFYGWVFRRLLQRSHVIALVASIGVAFFIRHTMTLFTGHEPFVFDVPIVRAWNINGLLLQPTDVAVAVAGVASLGLVFALLHFTALGRHMRAVADNVDLARSSGIDTDRVMIALWLLIGAIAAIAGTLVGLKSVIHPEMGWDLLLPGFAAAILGGFASPIGAVVGGLVIGLTHELAAPFVGYSYKLAVSFLIILAFLLWRPGGLFGRVEEVR